MAEHGVEGLLPACAAAIPEDLRAPLFACSHRSLVRGAPDAALCFRERSRDGRAPTGA
jgi:hypothetical protein